MRITTQDIRNNVRIGIEFEFYSSVEDIKIENLAKSISRVIKEQIIVFDYADYKKAPNYNKYTLTYDFSGGPKLYELITPPLKYQEGIDIINLFYQWINQYGKLNDKTSLHITLSFSNHRILNLKHNIEGLNKLKFILDFDENYIYQNFPTRKHNVYARSIKDIVKTNNHNSLDNTDLSYSTPLNRYYGVNFQKISKNLIEFRYIGGNYAKKLQETINVINYYIEATYNVLKDNEIDQARLNKLLELTKDYKRIYTTCSTYKDFKFNYPQIELQIDLKKDEELINFYYNQIKGIIFLLIINGNMKAGAVNYNTDTGLVEVKEAKIKNLHSINNVLFVDCEGDGLLLNGVKFYRCKLKNSILEDCQFMSYCEVSDSKLYNCLSEKPSEFKNCFIDVQCEKIIYFGIFEDCIFKNIMPGNNSEFIGDNNISVKEMVEKQKNKKDRFADERREKNLIMKGLYASWGDKVFKEIPPEYPEETYKSDTIEDDKPKIKQRVI